MAEKLCVKRIVKHNCCQGKCYLGKSLQKNSDDSTDGKTQLKLKIETHIAKDNDEAFKRVFIAIANNHTPKSRLFHPQKVFLSSFHPPQVG